LDITTILGIILGFGCMVYGIMLSGDLGSYIHFPSIIITLGGTLTSTLTCFPLDDIANTIKVLKKAFVHKDVSPNDVIREIIKLANIARKEGLLALDEYAESLEDDFLKKGIMLIVDGTEPELVRNILETELVYLEERHSNGQKVFETAANFAPAFGMIGTLIGLINMLRTLDDPSSIGPQMSVALVTTFYGTVLANVLFLPLAQKLKERNGREVLVKELMVEGILSIQAGENPRIIEEKLKTFVPPKMRKNFREELEKEGAQ